MLAVTGKAPGTRPGGIITPNQHHAPINDFGTADAADICVESRPNRALHRTHRGEAGCSPEMAKAANPFRLAAFRMVVPTGIEPVTPTMST